MLLWILLVGGLAIGVSATAFALAMGRAERRARRNLYTSLGLDEEAISALMIQKGPISDHLAQVRQTAVAGGARRNEVGSRSGAAQRDLRLKPAVKAARVATSERPALARARPTQRPKGRDRS